MKKYRLWAILVVFTMIITAGCSGKNAYPQGGSDPSEVTEDWRDEDEYIYLSWTGPDAEVIYYAYINEQQGAINLYADEHSKKMVANLILQDGVINDADSVRTSLEMSDEDGDGYDDVKCSDFIDGQFVTLVYLYDSATGEFAVNPYGSDDSVGRGDVMDDYARVAGSWYLDGDWNNGYIEITAEGNVTGYDYEDNVTYEGYIVMEEDETQAAGFWYSIYDSEGNFVLGFPDNGEPDMFEFYVGQDGSEHYVRNDYSSVGGYESSEEYRLYADLVNEQGNTFSDNLYYLYDMDGDNLYELLIQNGENKEIDVYTGIDFGNGYELHYSGTVAGSESGVLSVTDDGSLVFEKLYQGIHSITFLSINDGALDEVDGDSWEEDEYGICYNELDGHSVTDDSYLR